MGAEVKGSIMLVDDDADLSESLHIVLELSGYSVSSARDGADALDRLARDPLPAVILLDLMMPGMNGVEFRERQLRDPRIRDIPVVLLTGAGAQTVEPHIATGARLLRKPFDIDELFAVIDTLCAGRRAP